jgi:hypothetical protein
MITMMCDTRVLVDAALAAAAHTENAASARIFMGFFL